MAPIKEPVAADAELVTDRYCDAVGSEQCMDLLLSQDEPGPCTTSCDTARSWFIMRTRPLATRPWFGSSYIGPFPNGTCELSAHPA
jgi:hypothetical protein